MRQQKRIGVLVEILRAKVLTGMGMKRMDEKGKELCMGNHFGKV